MMSSTASVPITYPHACAVFHNLRNTQKKGEERTRTWMAAHRDLFAGRFALQYHCTQKGICALAVSVRAWPTMMTILGKSVSSIPMTTEEIWYC